MVWSTVFSVGVLLVMEVFCDNRRQGRSENIEDSRQTITLTLGLIMLMPSH